RTLNAQTNVQIPSSPAFHFSTRRGTTCSPPRSAPCDLHARSPSNRWRARISDKECPHPARAPPLPRRKPTPLPSTQISFRASDTFVELLKLRIAKDETTPPPAI